MRIIILLYSIVFIGLNTSKNGQPTQITNDSVDVLIKKSIELYYDYKIKESLDSAIKVVDYAHELDNINFKYRAHYIIASNFEVIEDFKNAKNHYQEALKFAKENKDSVFIIRSLNGLGNVHIELDKDITNSVSYYNKALDLAKRAKIKKEQFGPVLNLAWAYIDHNKFDTAFPYLIEAMDLADDWGGLYASNDVKYLLGRYYAGKGNFVKANALFNEVIKATEEKQALTILTDTYKAKSDLFEEIGETDSALFSIKKFLFYKDKFFDEEKLKQVEIAKVNFSIDEYQRELESIQKEKQYLAKIARNNIAITFTSIGLILLLVVIFFFYRGYRSKKKLNKVLKEKNEELLEAKTEAEKLTSVKSQFISTVSHELRTPLYGVVGITTLLMEDSDITTKHKKLLNSLKFSGDYLLDLINKVLKISKIESDNEKLTKTPTNLLQLSQNLLHSFDYQAKNKNNELVLEVQKELPEILLVDSLKLSEVLINLIGNSSKFTENGKIHLRIKINSIEDDEIQVRFEVEDNGLGIPEDKKEFVFEKFSQIGREFNKLEGTGLGLSIVKNLLEMMDSKIYLDSKEGRGTKFYFDLKLEIIDEKEDTKIKLNGQDETNVYRKILVAEDNKINQIVTKNLLDLIGYECTIVENGFNALQMVKKESFDLILMDLNMPYLNGTEATKRIREFDKTTPIVALTASELTEVQEECMAIGMNDIINKPLNKNDLRNIILKNLVK
ncbi:tetratricopeptide repeat-containing hybrid sensor histidine kinase/response regulator [Aquimarina mytili]|uniref:histidine kinase n=1 Tax=Aquimarina mytili TaxID=874423 RepID=A0A937D7I5_9FLAO|nr:response regulator [Aquimarina mytili]MBL0683125.1 response regulator [Aquimarina mytili]